MTIQQREIADGEIVVEVEGSLTGPDAEGFQSLLEELTEKKIKELTLDLSQTTGVNSTTIGRILLAQRKLEDSGIVLRIEGCSDAVYQTMTSINLDKIISIVQ